MIGIDGPAGSGKTTLTAALSVELGNCAVVHMDDLYNGWNQDLEVELGQRIRKSILDPLSNGDDASFEKYDWHEKQFISKQAISHQLFVILEGVGACNEQFADLLSFQIWIEADPSVVIERIVNRDGESVRGELPQWKIREAKYFENQLVKQRANLHVSGD